MFQSRCFFVHQRRTWSKNLEPESSRTSDHVRSLSHVPLHRLVSRWHDPPVCQDGSCFILAKSVEIRYIVFYTVCQLNTVCHVRVHEHVSTYRVFHVQRPTFAAEDAAKERPRCQLPLMKSLDVGWTPMRPPTKRIGS